MERSDSGHIPRKWREPTIWFRVYVAGQRGHEKWIAGRAIYVACLPNHREKGLKDAIQSRQHGKH